MFEPDQSAGDSVSVPDQQIRAAIRDLENRTLARVPGDVAKLVYLCSTRDYNSGRYHHDGLSMRFGSDAANTALARCHEDVFRLLLYCSLRELVESLQLYIQASGVPRDRILRVWQNLQAYHVLIPAGCDPLSADLFLSNIKLALALLEHRDQARRTAPEQAPVEPQLP